MKKSLFILCVLCVLFISGCMNSENKMTNPGRRIIEMPSASPKSVTQGLGYDNKKISWGLKKVKNGEPEVPQSRKEMLLRFDGYYIGDRQSKKLYLTFDEGYENGFTPKILDVLKSMQTPAAFFVTGPYIDKEKELIKRMTDEGHIVGNHTVNHPSMPEVASDEKLANELTALDEKYFAITGKRMQFLRPPKGEYSERTLAISKKLGYKTILWSSAYADWDVKNQKGTANAVKMITEQFHNGNIILMHAVSEDNANALEEIINVAKQQGYTFSNLNDL